MKRSNCSAGMKMFRSVLFLVAVVGLLGGQAMAADKPGTPKPEQSQVSKPVVLGVVPDLAGQTKAEAEKALKKAGFKGLFEGTGDKVTAQRPAPGTKAAQGSEVRLKLAGKAASPALDPRKSEADKGSTKAPKTPVSPKRILAEFYFLNVNGNSSMVNVPQGSPAVLTWSLPGGPGPNGFPADHIYLRVSNASIDSPCDNSLPGPGDIETPDTGHRSGGTYNLRLSESPYAVGNTYYFRGCFWNNASGYTGDMTNQVAVHYVEKKDPVGPIPIPPGVPDLCVTSARLEIKEPYRKSDEGILEKIWDFISSPVDFDEGGIPLRPSVSATVQNGGSCGTRPAALPGIAQGFDVTLVLDGKEHVEMIAEALPSGGSRTVEFRPPAPPSAEDLWKRFENSGRIDAIVHADRQNRYRELDEWNNIRRVEVVAQRNQPTNLRATVVRDHRGENDGKYAVQLTWQDNAVDEDGYIVRAKNPLPFSGIVKKKIGANRTSYEWTGITSARGFCFDVIAYKGDRYSKPSNKVCLQ